MSHCLRRWQGKCPRGGNLWAKAPMPDYKASSMPRLRGRTFQAEATANPKVQMSLGCRKQHRSQGSWVGWGGETGGGRGGLRGWAGAEHVGPAGPGKEVRFLSEHDGKPYEIAVCWFWPLQICSTERSIARSGTEETIDIFPEWTGGYAIQLLQVL